MGRYYDGTKLLSMKDINGNKPEIFMCTTNRTGGKTTYYGRLLVNRFIGNGDKFGLIYRYNLILSVINEQVIIYYRLFVIARNSAWKDVPFCFDIAKAVVNADNKCVFKFLHNEILRFLIFVLSVFYLDAIIGTTSILK